MKLITTNDYLLLIDEEAICKTGELYLTSIKNDIKPKSKGVIQAGDKIIAYYPLSKDAQELNLPLLPNPFEEDTDVEKLACTKYNVKDGIRDYDERYYNTINVAKAEAFIEGYKAAQSKQLPVSFEPEYEEVVSSKWGYGGSCDYKLKTIINSEGKQVLVGTYIQ